MKTVIEIGISMLENLEKLHSFGIIHSDIKPENILIQDKIINGKTHNVMLIDFGNSLFDGH